MPAPSMSLSPRQATDSTPLQAAQDDFDYGVPGLDGQEAPSPKDNTEDEIPPEEMTISDPSERLLGLLKNHWTIDRNSRHRQIEREWWEAALASRGEYDPSTARKLEKLVNKSRVYVKLTGSVVGASKTLIMRLFGGKFPWVIKPSPVPELDGINLGLLSEAREMAASQLPPDQVAGFLQQTDFQSEVQRAVDLASKKMDGMRQEMLDHLLEMNWEQRFWASFHPHVVYGTTVIQGPMTVVRRPRRWSKDDKGSWKRAFTRGKQDDAEAKKTEDDPASLRPDLKVLNLWTVYPDGAATCFEDAMRMTIRHTMNRAQLIELKNSRNFRKDAIDRLLERNVGHGNWSMEWWEASLYGGDIVTRNHDHFAVYEYHGFLTGSMLKHLQLGIPESAMNERVLATIWWSGAEILKVTVSNSSSPSLPFFVVPYEQVEGRMWGRGVPKQMDDSQDMYNAAQRATMDSMAASALPQYVVDVGRLSPRTRGDTYYPGKVWMVEDSASGARPVESFTPPPNFQHMGEIKKEILLHIQKETNLPDFVFGLASSTVHNRTAEGLEIQQQQALAFIRGVIGNYDKFGICPMITALYDWEMDFNPNDEIKGDYEVEARGVMGAISRELMMTKLGGLLNQIGDDLKYIIKTDKALNTWAEASGFVDEGLANTPEEAAALKAKDLQMQAQANAAENSQKVSPVTPPQNAALEVLQYAKDATNPAFGPALAQVVKLYQWTDPKWVAAIDAIEQQAAMANQGVLSPQDAAAMAADRPTDSGGPASPGDAGMMPQGGAQMADEPELPSPPGPPMPQEQPVPQPVPMPQMPPIQIHMPPVQPGPHQFQIVRSPNGALMVSRVQTPPPDGTEAAPPHP